MKSILLSIKPQWIAKILNEEKTIEVRKQFPKDYVGWVYIYCTIDKKNYLYWDWYDPPFVEEEWFVSNIPDIWDDDRKNINGPFNGKVIARFWCDKVEEILNYGLARRSETMMKELLKKSCLTMNELNEYAPHKEYKENDFIYAIHISKLEIFDRPKELSDFKPICQKFEKDTVLYSCIGCKYCNYDLPYPATRSSCLKKITKAPQNYCYIEGELEK